MSALNLLGTALAPGSALGGRAMPKNTTSIHNDPSSPGIVSHVDVLSASLSNISDIPDHDPLYPRSPTSPQASAALPSTNGGAIWETTVAAADVLDTLNKTTNTIPLDLNKRVSEVEKLRKDIKKKGNALDRHRAKKKTEAKAEEERKQKIRDMASRGDEEYDNNGMVKPSLSQSLKKYRNMASSTSKVVKVDTNEQSKKSSSKKMEVQIDSSSRKKSAVKGTSSTAKETVKVEKNTTKAAAIPTATKSSGDSVHFTSDAANNYYRAMKLGRSPPTATTNDNDAAKESMNDYMTFLRDKKQSSSTTTQQQQTNVITPKQSQTVPTTQQPQKKTREQLIAEALHITKTPTEISQYLLAQGDTIEYAEKMELYTEILTKQKELLKKKEKERAKLLNKVDKKNNKKKSLGVVNKLNILKGSNSNSNKNKITAPAVITPPKSDPPPQDFIHPVTSFDKHTIFSAKSDITDVQYGDTTKSLEGCSVATEQYVSSGLSPNEEEDEPTMNAFVNDTTNMMNNITKAASSPAATADYDPPIAEYPSPINSPNEDTLGYPDDEDPMALLDKVGLPTNMLPDRIKIDNGPTIDHLPSSPGCDGIELDLVHSPTTASNEDEQQKKEETQDVSKSKVRSLSPFLKTASTETTQDTDNKKKPIRSSSPLVKLKKKMTRSSSPLPPKIPNRPIVPVDPPETRLSLDDDGSVECSGVWDDVETNANDDDTEASDSVMIQNLPGADDDQIMLDNSHDEVEDDTDDSSKLMAIATIKRVDTAASSVPKKKKTSRMALAREKMTRLKLKKSTSATVAEEKAVEDEAATKKAAAADPDVDAEPPKQELPDDHTITSTTSSKERKKEKLKKIMEYRKKASPSVQPNESWASLARSESNLSERKSKKEGEKKTEDEMNRVELLELLKKEREAASSKEGSNDSNKSSSKDKEAREEAGSDTKRGEHEKQPIVREQSTFSADGVKHPVKHISVYPNTSEYDDNDDMTLPPELRKSERVDIWKEAVPSESFDSRVQIPNPKINGMTDAFLTCGEKMLELEDVDTLYDGDTFTVVDKSAKDGESNTVGDQTATKKQRNRFACGIDPEELKQDLVYEAKSIGQDVKTGIKAMGNDVKTGIRNSVRNLFGACDITNTGGVDVLDKNFNEIGDQLLGRVPMPKKRTNSTAKSSVEAPVSPDKNPADETPAVTVNPQAEKITDILSGTDAARKHFDGVYQNQNDAEQEAEVSKELDELMQKKEKPLTVEEKKQLYLQKLKSVSMKHL